MAKGNMLLGSSRGKVGDVVFYRMEGEQMARARNRHIKNPKSEAQQIQRAIAATVTQAYSYIAEICDHSFESVQYGVKSMCHFNKVNMKKLRTMIATDWNNRESSTFKPSALLTAQKVTTFAAVPYIISEGSLASAVNATRQGQYLGLMGKHKLEAESEEEVKFGDYLDILGLLDPSVMVTAIEVYAIDPVLVDMKGISGIEYGRFVYDTTVKHARLYRNAAEVTAADAALLLTDENIATLLPKYFEEYNSDFFIGLLQNSLNIPDNHPSKVLGGNGYMYACGAITSKLENGKWRRSNSIMAITPYRTGDCVINGLDIIQAAQNWSADVETIGQSEWYLNGGL